MSRIIGIGTATIPTSAGGTIDLVDSNLGGRTPNAAQFFVNADTTPTDANSAAHCKISIGATDGTRQWCCAVGFDNGGTNTGAYQVQADTAVATQAQGGGSVMQGTLSFNSWITNGVRLNVDVAAPSSGTQVTAVLYCATNAYAGTAAMSGLDTATDITAPGFGSVADKTAVFLAICGRTLFDETREFAGQFSYGMAANLTGGVAQAGVALASVHGQATAVVSGKMMTTRAFGSTYNNASQAWGEVSDFDASGFSVTARDSGTFATDSFGYLLIEMPVKVWVGQYDSPTATGDDDVTDPGWKPQFFQEVQTWHDTVNSLETTGLGGSLGVGLLTGDIQICLSNVTEDALTAPAGGADQLTDDQAIRFMSEDGTQVFIGTFDSFLSNGVRRNFTTTNGTARKWFGFALQDFNPGGYYYQQNQ